MNNKDSTSQYADLVNQPGLMDNVGDAFIEQGRSPALNNNQKLGNALMSGFGHGMKGGANSARQEKLAWLQEQSKQVAMLDASMKISIGKTEAKKASFANYAMDNFGDLKKLNDQLGVGDEVGFNELTAIQVARFAQENPDITKGMGEYDHAYGDNVYFKKSGKVSPVNNKDFFAPLISTLPEEMQRELPNLMSATAKNKFQKSDLFQDLTLEEKRASIANQYSQANQHNANANKATQEMNNPLMSPVQMKTKELNEVRFNTRYEETEGKRVLNIAYNQYIDNILDAEKKGLTGKSKPAEWKRYWAEVTGQSENMDVEEMLRISHANRVKELGGSNANIKQFEVAMDSAPSIKKDPAATIEFLEKIIARNEEFENETNYLGEKWEQNQYQGQERSILNDYRANNKPAQNQNNNSQNEETQEGMVLAVDPDTGEKMTIPVGSIKEAESRGLKISQ